MSTLALAIRHKCQMPQSTFFGRYFGFGLCPPPEPPVVSQRVVELEGLASASFGVAPGQCHSAIEPLQGLHSALVVPHLLSEETDLTDTEIKNYTGQLRPQACQ